MALNCYKEYYILKFLKERLEQLKEACLRHRGSIYLSLLILFDFIWFASLENLGIIMGDDIGLVLFCQQKTSLLTALEYAGGNKYRPVTMGVSYIMTALFGNSYAAYFMVNMILSILTSTVIFYALRRITRERLGLSAAITLLFIMSPFSYYYITQLFGLMESLALLLMVFVILCGLYAYWKASTPSFCAAVIILFILLLTHERYVVLSIWLVFVGLFMPNKPLGNRVWFSVFAVVPLVSNIIMKEVFFSAHFLEGTGGVAIDFNVVQILKFLIQGCASIIGLYDGPAYLAGATAKTFPLRILIPLGLAVAIQIGIFIIYFKQKIIDVSNKEKILEIKTVFLFVSAIGALTLAASITIRQEYRWLYSPFTVYAIFLAYMMSNITMKMKICEIFGVVMVIGMAMAATGNRSGLNEVYLFRATRIANEVYRNSIQEYGEQLSKYRIYIIGNNELQWAVGSEGASIFDIYLENDVEFLYANDLTEIEHMESMYDDQKEIKIFEMQGDLSVSEIKFAGYHTVLDLCDEAMHTVYPDTYADTPTGKGLCFLDNTSFTLLSGFQDKIQNVFVPGDAILYFETSMPYSISDGAWISIQMNKNGIEDRIFESEIYAGDEEQAYFIPLENIGEDCEFIFEISSPSGDSTADWVTFRNVRLLTEDMQYK